MKTPLRSKFIAALVGIVLALYAQVAAAPFVLPNLAGAAASQYVPGEVLVKFKPTASAQERAATVEALGHTVLANLNQPGWMHVKLAAGQTVETALISYRNDPNVEYVQPNYIYHATAVPDDPQYIQLWAFKSTGPGQIVGTFPPNSGTAGDDMNIEKAWDHITDCSSVVVAVVDSGVNYNQEDLAANMWNGGFNFPNHGFDYVDSDNDPMDLNGHGTHVAGIIGAVGNNAKGTTGVCWTASIMAVRVLDATGSGSDVTIIQGIDFAITNGAKVINMSLGHGGAFSQAFSDAITSAQSSGVVVVVSAGNATSNIDAAGGAHYPCNFTQPNLVCVAALDPNYALASFSNYGATSVDVGAPGTNILSTFAGATATINDVFNNAGTLNWTTSGGGWAYGTLGVSGNNFVAGGTYNALLNPSTYPSGAYANSADNRVYKTFPPPMGSRN